jgi:hypothetical protein
VGDEGEKVKGQEGREDKIILRRKDKLMRYYMRRTIKEKEEKEKKTHKREK